MDERVPEAAKGCGETVEGTGELVVAKSKKLDEKIEEVPKTPP